MAIDNSKEYILCAAIRRKQPREVSPYWDGTNDITNIEIGYRHHDIFQRFGDEVSKKMADQGFYTSKGRFVDRNEGMYIAWKAGQVDNEVALGTKVIDFTDGELTKEDMKYFYPLFSEDLYYGR